MNAKFQIRWRGKESGPFTRDEIEQDLKDNRIGLFHEIKINGNWMAVRDYLERRSPIAEEAGASSKEQDTSTGPKQLTGNPLSHGTGASLNLRWRGAVTGPYSLQEVERMLDGQEIGQLHEVKYRDKWMSLAELFVQKGLEAKGRHREITKGIQSVESSGTATGLKRGARIQVEHVTKEIKVNKRQKKLLDDVTFTIEPGSFVALIGPSGSGKSTLMDAINGRRPSTKGTVLINGVNLYENFSEFRRTIGYVPQKDIVHLPLSVEQEFSFAAGLRLSSEFADYEIEARILEVLDRLGLTESQEIRNENLSGGQLKRVSLGIEIVADPNLLFLDEATTGLDSCTEARMMRLFRELASDGRTVVCVTHNLDNVQLCDSVVILFDGRLVYFDSPDLVPNYFGIEDIGAVYEKLESKLSSEWSTQFETFGRENELLCSRQSEPVIVPDASPSFRYEDGFIESLRQFTILFRRYATITIQDHKNLGLLLIQAPIVACLLGLVFGEEDTDPVAAMQTQRILVFLMAVSAIWFGCINAAREIAKELPIYNRERMIGVRIGAYFGSKICVLLLLCAIQCAALVGIIHLFVKYEFDWLRQFASLFLTAGSGVMIGLFVSALVSSTDKAIALVPIILIPQVIFAGAIKQLNGFSEQLAQWTMISFWSYDAMLHTIEPSSLARFSYFESMCNIALLLTLFAFATCYVLRTKDTV